jgi:hypothetical protein
MHAVLNDYVLPVVYLALYLVVHVILRYWPLRRRLRLRVGTLIAVYAVLVVLVCAGYLLLAPHLPWQGSNGMYNYQFFTAVFVAGLLPFFLTRNSFFENLFIWITAANLQIAILGMSRFLTAWLQTLMPVDHPLAVTILFQLLFDVAFIPLVLRLLDSMNSATELGDSGFWRVVWIIPGSFWILSMLSTTVFNGDKVLGDILILVLRLAVLVVSLLSCHALARLLRREIDSATARERAGSLDLQLDLERRQYADLQKNIEQARIMRHDMRHQLLAIEGYLQRGDDAGAMAYCRDLHTSIGSGTDVSYCENLAVNALVQHYAARLQAAGAEPDFKLAIPARCGSIEDSDLCVLAGNLLENALEGISRCGDGPSPPHFAANAHIQGDYLVLQVQNSYCGKARVEAGRFISDKNGQPGIGLASVEALCAKYAGSMRTTPNLREDIWQVACMLNMHSR